MTGIAYDGKADVNDFFIAQSRVDDIAGMLVTFVL